MHKFDPIERLPDGTLFRLTPGQLRSVRGLTNRLYFTLEQAQTKLHRSRQSATRIFQELEYSGLIIRRKQGMGKPALITLNYPSDAKLIAKEAEDVQA